MDNKKAKPKSIVELVGRDDVSGNEPELANTKEIIEKAVMEAEKIEHICDLCARHRPIFVVDTDDMSLLGIVVKCNSGCSTYC